MEISIFGNEDRTQSLKEEFTKLEENLGFENNRTGKDSTEKQAHLAAKIQEAMMAVKSELAREGRLNAPEVKEKIGLIENLVNAVQGRNLNLNGNKNFLKKERNRLWKVIKQIRDLKDRDSILSRATAAIREELKATRVLIYHFDNETSGKVIAESLVAGWTPAQDETIPCVCFGGQKAADYKQQVFAIADIRNSNLTPYQIQLLEKFQVKASLTLPIALKTKDVREQVWGLLVIQQCNEPRQWNEADFNFLDRLTVELSVALQPSEMQQGMAQQIEREKAIAQIIQSIQQANDLYEIFKTATQKVRQLLKSDRVVVYRFNPDWSGEVLAESVGANWVSVMEIQKVDKTLYSTEMNYDERCTLKDLKAGSVPSSDTYLQKTQGGEYVKGKQFQVVNDVYAAGFSPCYLNSLEKYQAKAYVIVPIFQKKKLWGLFATYQNSAPRNWEFSDVNLMMQLATPLGIAIQQAENVEELKAKVEQEVTIAKVAENIRQSLNLKDIFRTATQEVRQLLSADRVVVYRFNPDWSGEVLAESVGANWVSVMEIQKVDKTLYSTEMNYDERCTLKDLKAGSVPSSDTYLQKTQGGEYVKGKQFQVVNDVDKAGFSACYLESLRKYQAKAYIIVPIFQKKKLWGLFAVYQNSAPREWKRSDTNLMVQLSTPLGVAIQQAEFIEELQSKAEQEAAIDLIIERIRQSLDLNDIFRTATQEIRKVLEADRVVVYRFNPDWSGEVIAESVGSQWVSVLQLQKNDKTLYSKEMSADERCTLTSLQASTALDRDTYFRQTQGGNYTKGKKFQVVNDIYAAGFSACYLESLEKYQAKAYIIVPIFQNNELKGLLATYQNSSVRNWEKSAVELMLKIAPQLSFALQQASYIRQIQGQSEQLRKTVEREKGLARLLDRLQQAKNSESVFQTVCQETRKLMEVDRVAIYRFLPDWSSEFVNESAVGGYSSLRNSLPIIKDSLAQETQGKLYTSKDAFVVEDIYAKDTESCFVELIQQLEAKAYIIVPISLDEKSWGLLCAFQNSGARRWEPEEATTLKQVALQISIALERINFLEQLRVQSENLAQTVEREKAAKDKLRQQAVNMLSSVKPAFKGDLTVRAAVTEDEIGTIAAAYNTTLDSLRDIVVQVKTAVEQVALTAGTSTTSIQGLSNQAQQQFQELNQALIRIQEMVDSTEVTTKNAKQVEVAIEQANKTVQIGDKAMNSTVESILGIRQTVSEASKGVKRLSDSSQKISKVVNLISSFAAQTNLLALNAALEATRAGEYGKGFAVVADEVRNLSIQSTEATSEIEKLVQEIQNETQEVASAMETGIEQVAEGTSLVNQTRESLTAIVTSTTEISSLVEGITRAAVIQTQQAESVTKVMTDVAAIANGTSSDSLTISASIQELQKMAQNLQASVAQFKVS